MPHVEGDKKKKKWGKYQNFLPNRYFNPVGNGD